MPEPVIVFKDFSFRYRAQAENTLKSINLTVMKGEKILICGPSGCGKSTLGATLNGLVPSYYPGDITGTLMIGGKSREEWDIFSLSKLTGTVLQDSDGQFVGLTVGDDIAFALENDAVESLRMKERVLSAAEKVGMEAFLGHAPDSLSGGQKQRVSLAGILVDNVSIYLFDEPLANLDPESGERIIGLIDTLQKSTSSTVIIIEHRIEDVLSGGVDRVIVMNDGRIISRTAPDSLLSSRILEETGIREPLYISALRYAGVPVTEDMKPGRTSTLRLSRSDTEKIRAWFHLVGEKSRKSEGETVLSVENLSFSYPERPDVLKDVSFSIRKGEMVSIVGKNGAGKSTLIKLICGFEKEDRGTIRINGSDISSLSIRQRAEKAGYVMQNPNQMITCATVMEEVTLGLKMRGLPDDEAVRKGEQALSVCGLFEYRSWPVSALSYGQKKRLTTASVLALEPQIIILDEPTAGQDFRHYTAIMEFLKNLASAGITVIMITHDMHLMLEYCTRSLVFSDGILIKDASPEEVLTDTETAAKAALKKTSLSFLAEKCSLDETEFVRRFIRFDRENRQ